MTARPVMLNVITANEAEDKYFALDPVTGSTHKFPMTNSDERESENCMRKVHTKGAELVKRNFVS